MGVINKKDIISAGVFIGGDKLMDSIYLANAMCVWIYINSNKMIFLTLKWL